MTDKQTAARIEPIGTTRLEKVVESLIFAADDPITARQIASVYAEFSGEDEPGPAEIASAVERINASFVASDRALRIEAWAGGYRFATIKEVAAYVAALFTSDRQRKLSRTLMESLAILAYRQPVTRSEIEFIRGVDCDYALRKLMEYGLIDVTGRAETVGRPLLYGTTDRFLELFGLNSLSDLPTLRELESLLDDPAFQKEKARMLMTTGIQLPLSAEDEKDAHSDDSLQESSPEMQSEHLAEPEDEQTDR